MRDGGKTRRAGAELSRCEGQEGGVARAGRMKEGGGNTAEFGTSHSAWGYGEEFGFCSV